MFTYFYRILDKYEKPVTAIAILTDKNKKYRPEKYEYNFLGTSNIYRFNTYKIIDQDEEKLAKSDNPFAIVILTVLLALKSKTLRDKELLGLKVKIVRNLLNRNINPNKVKALMAFLKLYVNFANSETSIKFDEKISNMTTETENKEPFGVEERVLDYFKKEGMKKGLQKGLQKGRKEGQVEFVKSLITKTEFSDTQIADIVGVSLDFVKKNRQKLKK